MPRIIDWHEALVNPCFWVNRYYEVDPSVSTDLFGVSSKECQDYYLKQLLGCKDDSKQADEDLDRMEGSILTIPFPEDYTWTIHFTYTAISHTIYHPQMYPAGARIAVESGHGSLPGLRWSELKQMVACLRQWGKGNFDARTIFPLLYPVVWLVTFAELDDVRQTLHAAWDVLHVLDASQLNRWIDEMIVIYDKGKVLFHDPTQGWHEAIEATRPSAEESLWIYDPKLGWHTNQGLRQDSQKFASFFAMLERYAPTQE